MVRVNENFLGESAVSENFTLKHIHGLQRRRRPRDFEGCDGVCSIFWRRNTKNTYHYILIQHIKIAYEQLPLVRI